MLICFFDQEGIVHWEFVPPGMMVNADVKMCGARGHRNGKTRTSLSTTTMPWLTGPLKFHSFWPRTIWQWSPIPHTHPIWPLVTFPLPQAEASDEGSKIWHHWRDSRGIAVGTWHNSKKGLPGMLPSMADMLGPLYLCKRGILWRWWRNLTSNVSTLLFTSTVLELLDTPLYDSRKHNVPVWLHNHTLLQCIKL